MGLLWLTPVLPGPKQAAAGLRAVLSGPEANHWVLRNTKGLVLTKGRHGTLAVKFALPSSPNVSHSFFPPPLPSFHPRAHSSTSQHALSVWRVQRMVLVAETAETNQSMTAEETHM